MEEKHVVTCFLEYEGKILLLKRSSQVSSYQYKWAGISGYIEPENTPLKQAEIELYEETGLKNEEVELIKEGDPIPVIDEKMQRKWIVHPFHFRLLKLKKLKLDWEHTEFRWMLPEQMLKLSTVPGLYEAWERVK
ncbi:NUDIX pyrophosphatase [Thermosyntropha sp.]|uniref:NUDIX pyrophosphatase n=1 Tax=Thermosyntropha sp. TaxID=2740820 RepID=UPI0025D6B203|nr:NUDIX pyrophosphatase [Thermosyntropha sp.]MBO8159136.1 NUDIX pyrophosphatase [Thermosyntropha sp.]